MRFDVLTLFPDMIESHCSYSILKRAIESGVIEVKTVNPRDFTIDKHKKVDDTPYGGGAGMVLMAQPYVDAYESVEQVENSITIMLSPQGEPMCEQVVRELSHYDQIICLCGHYEGFDERIREIIKPREISLGDFVLTGGELPALCLIDAVSRKIEGTLGKIESAEDDSFSDGLLEYPQYTKPREYRGLKVPEVLLNGNHKEIDAFRQEQRLIRTKARRPDLLK
ncbi:tRNA (guanosine(37)-N1)-methyltransferase TrmD [bacterium]|nr:tRNA (guanosine(37)-N1)-methyltransferase TrmD [bacterium]